MVMKDKKIGKRFRIAKYKILSYSLEKKQQPEIRWAYSAVLRGKKGEKEGDNMTYPYLLRKKNVLITLTKGRRRSKIQTFDLNRNQTD